MSSTIYGYNKGNVCSKKQWIIRGKIDMSKVLDSIGNWTLEKVDDDWEKFDNPPSGNKARHVSLVKHECYPERTKNVVHQVVVYPEDSERCWRCEEVIPDKMVVLWRFMNHDQIQYRKRNL
jgi:hypothetical protein